MVEYVSPELARELGWVSGTSADNSWMDPVGVDADGNEEYQPEREPPHIPDYKELKAHPHYKQYFKAYQPQKHPFPCWLYHRTKEPVLIDEWDPVTTMRPNTKGQLHPVVVHKPNIERCKAKIATLGPGWATKPFEDAAGNLIGVKRDMTGKTLPVESETERQTKLMAEMMNAMGSRGPGIAMDPMVIATAIAAAMKIMQGKDPAAVVGAASVPEQSAVETTVLVDTEPVSDDPVFAEFDLGETEPDPVQGEDIQRQALIELAKKEGIKIDQRWSTPRIREALGL